MFFSPVCFSIIKKSDEVTWSERREAASERAITRWLYLVTQWDRIEPELKVCCSISSCSSSDMQKVLRDWLHSKAPGTLLKRVNALLRYHRAVGWGDALQGLPYDEEKLYNYLADSRSGGAKASQLKALRESLIFVRHVFSLEILQQFAEGRRCVGAVKGPAKVRRRAPPLKIPEIRKLHSLLSDDDAPIWDRMFAGAALACLYMRSRRGDFQQTDSVSVDRDASGCGVYLEYRATCFKTMNAQFWDGEPAFWIAPALGVVSVSWLDVWLRVRDELGLGDTTLPLPVPDSEGNATLASHSQRLAPGLWSTGSRACYTWLLNIIG